MIWGSGLRVGSGSWDTEAYSSLWRLLLQQFWWFHDQYHAHDFNCSYNVKQQRLAGLWSFHDWERRQVLLQLQECLICFLSLDKGSGLP
jgi:hypothetical protein